MNTLSSALLPGSSAASHVPRCVEPNFLKGRMKAHAPSSKIFEPRSGEPIAFLPSIAGGGGCGLSMVGIDFSGRASRDGHGPGQGRSGPWPRDHAVGQLLTAIRRPCEPGPQGGRVAALRPRAMTFCYHRRDQERSGSDVRNDSDRRSQGRMRPRNEDDLQKHDVSLIDTMTDIVGIR
jgi:hypothetical protein